MFACCFRSKPDVANEDVSTTLQTTRRQASPAASSSNRVLPIDRLSAAGNGFPYGPMPAERDRADSLNSVLQQEGRFNVVVVQNTDDAAERHTTVHGQGAACGVVASTQAQCDGTACHLAGPLHPAQISGTEVLPATMNGQVPSRSSFSHEPVDRVAAWLSHSDRESSVQAGTVTAALQHSLMSLSAGAFESADATHHVRHSDDSDACCSQSDSTPSINDTSSVGPVSGVVINSGTKEVPAVNLDHVIDMLARRMAVSREVLGSTDGDIQATGSGLPGALTQADGAHRVLTTKTPPIGVAVVTARSGGTPVSSLGMNTYECADWQQPAFPDPGANNAGHAAAMVSKVQRVFFDESSSAALLQRASSGMHSAATLQASEDDGISSSGTSLVTPLYAHMHKHGYTGAPKPSNEPARMSRLCSLGVLSTAAERRFDRLTAFVATVYNVPVVLVSLVDTDRQWFKSVVGLPGVSETDRESSFCAWTLLPPVPECLVVCDARSDARFARNSLVLGGPRIQFYAGCPTVSSNGARMGSFCIIDSHRRHFSREDCQLLVNFAELTVRELESTVASDRRNFGDGDTPDASLRTLEAWDVGIMVVSIVHDSWIIGYANDRAGEVLGVDNVDDFSGLPFWDHFKPRVAGAPSIPAARVLATRVAFGKDFELEAHAFTSEGRKIWVTCSFRAGAQSQVDDNVPTISMPMDVASEPGSKSQWWFVTVRKQNTAKQLSLRSMQPPQESLSLRLSGWLSEAQGGIEDCITEAGADACIRLSQSVSFSLLNGQSEDGAGVVVQLVPSLDAPACAAALQQASARHMELGLAGCVMLGSERIVPTSSDVVVLHTSPASVMMTVFKFVPTARELYEGVVRMDVGLALACASHVLGAACTLHDAGSAHGEINDAVILVGMCRQRVTAGEAWHLGKDISIWLAPPSVAAPRLAVADLAAIRADLPLFYAPERFDADHILQGACGPPGDVWAVGMLLLFMLHHSLPLQNRTPVALVDCARKGTLVESMLHAEEAAVPAAVLRFVLSCVEPDAARRVTSRSALKELEALRVRLGEKGDD